jgi:hypothetical protein
MNETKKVELILLSLLGACADPAPPAPPIRHEALELAREEAIDVEPVGQVDGEGEIRGARDPNDLDRDGVPAEADLDDLDELIGRQLPEIPCDGIDQDGDFADACEVDVDGDGAAGDWDCDDLDPEIGPGAREVRCNGEDENCNGADDCDRDGDGLRDVDDPGPDDPAVAMPREEVYRRWR